jgi:hypothetical protein
MDCLSETSTTLLEESAELGQRVRFATSWKDIELTLEVWTLAPNWPNNGEIDIMEGVNQNMYNAATLHS